MKVCRHLLSDLERDSRKVIAGLTVLAISHNSIIVSNGKELMTFVDVCVVIRPGVTGVPLTVDLRSPTTASNGVLSPSSAPSFIGWDSRTPLIHSSSPDERLVLQQPPTSPALSVDSLGGATDTTELDNYASDSAEATSSLSMSIIRLRLYLWSVTDGRT